MRGLPWPTDAMRRPPWPTTLFLTLTIKYGPVNSICKFICKFIVNPSFHCPDRSAWLTSLFLLFGPQQVSSRPVFVLCLLRLVTSCHVLSRLVTSCHVLSCGPEHRSALLHHHPPHLPTRLQRHRHLPPPSPGTASRAAGSGPSPTSRWPAALSAACAVTPPPGGPRHGIQSRERRYAAPPRAPAVSVPAAARPAWQCASRGGEVDGSVAAARMTGQSRRRG